MSLKNGNGFWVKLGLVLVPLVLMWLVAWGQVQSNLSHLADEVETKASREVENQKDAAILRELQSINRRLDRIEGMR